MNRLLDVIAIICMVISIVTNGVSIVKQYDINRTVTVMAYDVDALYNITEDLQNQIDILTADYAQTRAAVKWGLAERYHLDEGK